MDIINKLKNIGLGTGLILCVAAIIIGNYLISDPVLDSIRIEGRGWADTMASVILAGTLLIGIYSIAAILIAIGSFGSFIIVVSFVAAQLDKSINPEDHKLLKWALGMLTFKKLLIASILILITVGGVSYASYELDSHLRKSFNHAAYYGDMERVTSLLGWRWFVDLEQGPAMRFAAEKGHLDIVKLLIAEGFPASRRTLQEAAEEGHIEIVKFLLDSGVPVNEIDMAWVVRGESVEIVELLLEQGAELKGTSALTFAAARGNSELVALLIEAGVELNDCKSNQQREPRRLPVRINCTPAGLKRAINNRHLKVTRMLIEAGANVLALAEHKNATNGYRGRTFVQLAMSNGAAMRQLLESALEWPLASNVINAAQTGDWDRLKRVVALGADVNQAETSHDATYGWTALMYAADQGHVEIVDLLLNAGADASYISPESVTALSLASTNGHGAVVKLLRAAGAVQIEH